MTLPQAITRAIAALREQVKRGAANANLAAYGATSPEVTSAVRERRLNLIAIEMLQEMIRDAKVQSKARRESKTY